MKWISPLIIGIVAVTVFYFFSPNPMREIEIRTADNSYHLLVEVADSPGEQTQGLMGRKELPDEEGMLFVYEEDTVPNFWMKNMEIPLDMVFIGADGVIRHIEANVPPCITTDDNCIRYSSKEPVRSVLELAAGFTERYGVKAGDRIITNFK